MSAARGPDFRLGPALLFCPADRPDRYLKARERSDAVILDLEDAVAPESRASAREALRSRPLDPATTIVRVNAAGTPDFEADLAALAQTDYRMVLLAKAESTAQLEGLEGFAVIALCENARGVMAAPALAACENVVALMWGAEDLIASLGGTSSRDGAGRYRDSARHARSTVLLSAKAAGKAAIDAVHLAIDDEEGLSAEARDAAASGFDATACIHPRQVALVREAYRPSEAELADAEELLTAAQGQAGVFSFRGRMVDAPVLRHAETVLRRAGMD